MIVRKPYAILIKFFKIIHIGLFVLSLYVMFSLRHIFLFFKDFVTNNNFIFVPNMHQDYINSFLYVAIIIMLISGIAIFYLMREKEKPILFYQIFIVYCAFLLIMLFVYKDFFISLEFKDYNKLIISIYRDISATFYYFSFLFVGLTFVRGFGFDIKKFSFDKDLKELNIGAKDNEEYELSFSFDKEKILNYFHRKKRLSKYFFKENAMILSIIGIIAFILCFIVFYKGVSKKHIYNQNTPVIANGVEYLINKVYITNNNIYNENMHSSYVIINFSVTNKNVNSIKIPVEKMKLNLDDKCYYPITSQYNYFIDLGNPYENQAIEKSKTYNYIVAFLIYNNNNYKKMVLDVYDGKDSDSKNMFSKYKKIRLDPVKFVDKKIGDYKIKDEILLGDTLYKDIKLIISNYIISDSFIYEYKECNPKCQSYKKIINSRNKKVLKLETNLEKEKNRLLDYYLSLTYVMENQTTTIFSKDLHMLYYDDGVVYFEIDSNVNKSNKIMLTLNIRGISYNIWLN